MAEVWVSEHLLATVLACSPATLRETALDLKTTFLRLANQKTDGAMMAVTFGDARVWARLGTAARFSLLHSL